MRVITGIARGRKLLTLEGDGVRPTIDRVKEAVFSIIQFEIEGRRVLDLFAGSGQLGVEALSRGAKSALFVDSNPAAAAVVRQNIEKCGFERSASVVCGDGLLFLKGRKETYDIIFLDPPFGQNLIEKALPLVSEKLAAGGVAICETPDSEELPEECGNLSKIRKYIYGRMAITVYRPRLSEE